MMMMMMVVVMIMRPPHECNIQMIVCILFGSDFSVNFRMRVKITFK